jgi:hypothetical protein
MTGAPTDLINLARYPINNPEAPEYQKILQGVHAALSNDGCAVLKGFLTPAGVQALAKEANAASPNAHASFNRTNPYFTQDDENLPADHPMRQFYDRSNAFIPADNFTKQGALRQVQDHAGFDSFIQACLGEKDFYRYADPLADAIINMAGAGNGFPWHFDTNNFTVTLAVQNAEQGGAFEYAPNIRRDGESFDEVSAVLQERSDKVKVLNLEPGDLQLFRGRYSLHRVAPLSGQIPRYVAIYSYVDQPDMVATPERCQQLYGRTLPIHHERGGIRNDAYLD